MRTTYILPWSPKRWPWPALAQQALAVQKGTPTQDRWVCGANREIKPGDRIFLMQVDVPQAGIFASGWAASGTSEAPYADELEPEMMRLANFVFVELDTLIYPESEPILYRQTLAKTPPFSSLDWEIQAEGLALPAAAAYALEQAWETYAGESLFHLAQEIPLPEATAAGAANALAINAYEADPIARRRCLHQYGVCCAVCGMDFEQLYGVAGHNLIQMHHLPQFHEIDSSYRLDAVKHLRPVCPNCHAVIHLHEPHLSISAVQEALKRARR